jgi:transcriptional regulator with XRE-family HTH domain
MNISQELGAIIKKLRKDQKLSQKQLSQKIYGNQNSNATISRIEKGDWEKTNFITINNVLNALGVDVIALIKTKLT